MTLCIIFFSSHLGSLFETHNLNGSFKEGYLYFNFCHIPYSLLFSMYILKCWRFLTSLEKLKSKTLSGTPMLYKVNSVNVIK